MQPRVQMDSIIRDIAVTGRKNLTSADCDSVVMGQDISESEQPTALQRVVGLLNVEPENKVAQLEADKFMIQRNYGTNSLIYLANGHSK